MRRRKLLYSLGASGAVLVPSGLTAAAYNSFSVSREAKINVVQDGAGILNLQAGNSPAVQIPNSSNKLTIDLSQLGGSTNGINQDATLGIGDGSNVSGGDHAFSFTNQASSSRDISFEYDTNLANSADTSTSENVTFEFYSGDGSQVTDGSGNAVRATEEDSAPTTISVGSGSTYYTVLSIDTTGLGTDANLSGTLTISI